MIDLTAPQGHPCLLIQKGMRPSPGAEDPRQDPCPCSVGKGGGGEESFFFFFLLLGSPILPATILPRYNLEITNAPPPRARALPWWGPIIPPSQQLAFLFAVF